jgi:hypothetical protein
MLAVEERHDLEQDARQEEDGVGVTRGVAEGDAPPAFVLDGKGVDPPEPREVLSH